MSTENPRTARDALIIELLGDIGAVHDEIKLLPNNLKDSLRGSLEIIADSVETAEKTSQELKTHTVEALKAISDLQIEKLDKETRIVIEEFFSRVVGDEIRKTERIASNLQETLEKFPNYFGNQYKKLCYLFAAVAGVSLITLVVGMSVLFIQSKSWEQRTIGVFNAYQEQQKIIMTLPPEMRDKFRK
jgi:dGTP triphosphohydrolase